MRDVLKGVPGEIVLEDGFRLSGRLFGPPQWGEVVFTTVMTGYSEVASDPSYAGQIVVMTFPLIGVYGVPLAQLQHEGPTVAALVVRELHLGEDGDIGAFLGTAGRPILTDVDTRALVRHLREAGTMWGALLRKGDSPNWQRLSSLQLVRQVAVKEPYVVGPPGGRRLALVDFGVKQDIVRQCIRAGFEVHVFPPDTPAETILAEKPELVVLSNGPGDPAELGAFLPGIRRLAMACPTFGICLGHQLLALAFGARTYRLKYGHRGGNHPVRERASGRVVITSQNHGYAVDPSSLDGTGLMVTHENANDGSVEGIRHRELPVWSLQYHPEAGPGPWDERVVFDRLYHALEEAGSHA